MNELHKLFYDGQRQVEQVKNLYLQSKISPTPLNPRNMQIKRSLQTASRTFLILKDVRITGTI